MSRCLKSFWIFSKYCSPTINLILKQLKKIREFLDIAPSPSEAYNIHTHSTYIYYHSFLKKSFLDGFRVKTGIILSFYFHKIFVSFECKSYFPKKHSAIAKMVIFVNKTKQKYFPYIYLK